MFIYHFSRLIKSKLLWGMLALLMVFAFVVADSCSGTSSDATVAKFGETSVGQTTVRDAECVVTALGNLQSIPNPSYSFADGMFRRVKVPAAGENMNLFWMLTTRTPLKDEEAEMYARQRYLWTLLAAREVGARNGLAVSEVAAQNALMDALSTADNGYTPEAYARFAVDAGVQAAADQFTTAYTNVWVPTQGITLAVLNSTGWVSPMERAFVHAATFDKTTAQVAVLKNTLTPDAITVADADVQAWYEAHLNDYSVPEQREIAYVEIPMDAFVEKAVVTDDDAIQYYEENPDQFKGTNETDTLPFLEVKDKALAEMKKIKGLDDAYLFATLDLVDQVKAQGIDALTATYGAVKMATVREDRPFGFQNASDVISGVFQQDLEESRYNVVRGTDRIYFIELKQVISEHIAPLEAVQGRVISEARQDLLKKALEENGEKARAIIEAQLAQGKTFTDAVAACNIEGFTASEAVEFVINDRPQLTIPHAEIVKQTAPTLGVGAVSKPEVVGEEVVLTYVSARTPGDPLTKNDELVALAEQASVDLAFMQTKAWLDWNLAREEPLTVTGVPLLTDGTEE